VDLEAQEKWSLYTVKKFQMLSESNRSIAPWWIIRSDNKKAARLNSIRMVLNAIDYPDKAGPSLLTPDPEIVISGIDEIAAMELQLRQPGHLLG